MSSKSVSVGRVRERPPHEGAEFGCRMGRREIFLRTVVTFPDSCITADYQVSCLCAQVVSSVFSVCLFGFLLAFYTVLPSGGKLVFKVRKLTFWALRLKS